MQPSFDVLEDRCLMAGGITATLSAGTLRIDGTERADQIRVTEAAGVLSVEGARIRHGGRVLPGVPEQSVRQIRVYAHGGNDRVFLDAVTKGGLGAYVYGGMGNDEIRGTSGKDYVYGEAGNDILDGAAGDDFLSGGTGLDTFRDQAHHGDDTFKDEFNLAQPVLDGVHASDIIMGRGAETCGINASLAGAALRGMDLAGRISYRPSAQSYSVLMVMHGRPTAVSVKFDGTWRDCDSQPTRDGAGRTLPEFWALLYQRAYLTTMGVDWTKPPRDWSPENYIAIEPGLRAAVLDGMAEEAHHVELRPDGVAAWEQLTAEWEAGAVIVASTTTEKDRLDYDTSHAYTVMAVFPDSVTLRNPSGSWKDGGNAIPVKNISRALFLENFAFFCFLGGRDYHVQMFTDPAAFRAALNGAVRIVDFEDLAAGSSPVSFAEDRYGALGIRIRGAGGQYASSSFGFPDDYVPRNGRVMYAPGPTAPRDGAFNEGGHETTVTFEASGSAAYTAGFGATFIDVDYPSLGASSLTVRGPGGRVLGSRTGFATRNAASIFVGFVALDRAGNPVPVFSSARLGNGSGFAGVYAAEGVVLDDFIFGIPT